MKLQIEVKLEYTTKLKMERKVIEQSVILQEVQLPDIMIEKLEVHHHVDLLDLIQDTIKNLKIQYHMLNVLITFIIYSPFYYKKQRERANESPLYLIGDSCFSTLTLNYNWRTACHYDVGDYTDGLSIISVLGDDNWEGCLIGFPKYKIAVDVRVGDIIIMDSHEMHCNTEFKDSPDNDGNAEFNRLSVVFYLRQNMNNCKSIPNGIKKN